MFFVVSFCKIAAYLQVDKRLIVLLFVCVEANSLLCFLRRRYHLSDNEVDALVVLSNRDKFPTSL